MANIWILAEAVAGDVKPVTYELLTAARALGGDKMIAVVIGAGAADCAADVGAHGADQVLVLDDPRLEAYSPDGWAGAVADLIASRGGDVLLAASTVRGRELAPRVAARLGVGVASDVTGITVCNGHLEVVRPIYAGKALARARLTGNPSVVTVRPGSFPRSSAPGDGGVERITLGEYSPAARATDLEVTASERPDVSEADVIVSGGRGMGGPEHFHLLESLAHELGAAVGASRAAVDAGWRPHKDQVGQTGKTVSPKLYIACGISGAVQHLAGMKSSNTIVAINKDPEAPIFAVADYGIVGDVFDVLPALTEAVRKQTAR